MTKDVLITISGVQIIEDEDADVEMVVRGDYYQKNGKHYIVYEERMEGFEGVVKNVIKVSPGAMDIIKKGVASTHMQFEQDQKNLSCYNTPMGDLIVGIHTSSIQISEGENRLRVNVEYELDINYQHASNCNIMVDVRSLPLKPEQLLF